MRAMLGEKDGEPRLLVEIEEQRAPDDFDFYALNGAWYGVYRQGRITVLGATDGDFSTLDKDSVILTTNQDRLRGDWRGVFDNFSNPDYVAPPDKAAPAHWDDDIPF